MIVDFEKIKTAAEDIKLTDTEKENIILLCEESKKTKKKSRFVPVAAAAAVAVFAFVIFSPGFLLKASEADTNYAPQENAVADEENYGFLADSYDGAQGIIVQSSTTENPDFKNDEGGGVITVQKYRAAFYSVPASFVNLVGKETFFAWRETIDATSTAETMVMSQFIQHFGITREQFDKANLKWAKGIQDNLYGIPCINPKDYANQETDEVFNGDIIFTFDDNLIREYYLSPDYPYLYDIEFEEAVARGEYTSQTEDWVDIEAMEAEIIAKYGEAEIVTQ